MRELTADLFISVDSFASGAKEAAFFGYFGEELGSWVSDHLHQPQLLIMGRATYEVLALFAACARIFDAPVDGVWASDHFGLIADFAVPERI